MKFTENSLVVDVVKISNSSYKLSVPAGDLLTAAMNGAVLRRHDLSTAAVPNVLYVPLSEAKLSSGTYSFTFASGDKFTASAADAYPAASSVSDETGGGSGGLPTPTAEDVGKVATVVEEISKGTVIAAEQTVTLNSKTGKGYINNVDKSLMTDGAILIVTIEDVEYVVTCVAEPILEPITCGDFTIEDSSESKLTISALGVAEPIDVAINLGVASYSWQPAVSGGGVPVVTATDGTLDKTWQEIHDGGFCVLRREDDMTKELLYGTLNRVYTFTPFTQGATTQYCVEFVTILGESTISSYKASSADGYPAFEE